MRLGFHSTGRLRRLAALAVLLLSGCGGGGGGSSPAPTASLTNPSAGSNVAAVSIRQLETNTSTLTANTPYVDVTV